MLPCPAGFVTSPCHLYASLCWTLAGRIVYTVVRKMFAPLPYEKGPVVGSRN